MFSTPARVLSLRHGARVRGSRPGPGGPHGPGRQRVRPALSGGGACDSGHGGAGASLHHRPGRVYKNKNK